MLHQFCITWQYRRALSGSLVTGGETDRTSGAGTCETTEGQAVVASPDARARGKTVSRLKGVFYAIGEEGQAAESTVICRHTRHGQSGKWRDSRGDSASCLT